MSDNVEVPFGKNGSDTATLLLVAAQELGLPASVVTVKGRVFTAPAEVAKKAEHKPAKKNEGDESKDDEPKRTTKKVAAKKPASKDKE